MARGKAMKEFVIATTEISGELWKVHSKYDSEEAALAAIGASGNYILQVEIPDLSVVAIWRWDKSGRWVRAEWGR